MTVFPNIEISKLQLESHGLCVFLSPKSIIFPLRFMLLCVKNIFFPILMFINYL